MTDDAQGDSAPRERLLGSHFSSVASSPVQAALRAAQSVTGTAAAMVAAQAASAPITTRLAQELDSLSVQAALRAAQPVTATAAAMIAAQQASYWPITTRIALAEAAAGFNPAQSVLAQYKAVEQMPAFKALAVTQHPSFVEMVRSVNAALGRAGASGSLCPPQLLPLSPCRS